MSDIEVPLPPEEELYRSQLTPAHAALFVLISSCLSVSGEIKLMRLVTAVLAADPAANHAHITRSIGTMVRLLALQARYEAGNNDFARELEEVANQVLAGFEGE